LIEENGNTIIIDAGTGILNYFETTNSTEHHILFTHYHLDHVIGLPFVNKLFDKFNSFFLYGPKFNDFEASKLLPSLLNDPFLPFTIEDIKANINNQILLENGTLNINGFIISSYVVDHPGKSMVFSIQCNGEKISVLTDLPNNSKHDPELIEFCSNSDIIYIDSYYLEEEILNSSQKDFGHSSIESAISIKGQSNSKTLVLGHHRYNRQKSELSKYESENVIIAEDNITLKV
jgi:ribonuclease BN (tRNA processing enzyme)